MIYVNFVAKQFVHMQEKNGIANEAIFLEWVVSSNLWDFEVVKKSWDLLSVKCCYFMWKQLWDSLINFN